MLQCDAFLIRVNQADVAMCSCQKEPCSGVSSVGTGNEAGASLTRSTRIWQEPKSRLNGAWQYARK